MSSEHIESSKKEIKDFFDKKENLNISKPNIMISGRHSLSLVQSKVLFMMLARVKAFADSNDGAIERKFKIPTNTFITNFKKSHGGALNAYIDEEMTNLMEKVLTIRTIKDPVSKKETVEHFNLVSKCKRVDGESFIEAAFNKDVIPILKNMALDGYTILSYEDIFNLKSTFSVRIYELLLKVMKMAWVKKEGYTISVDELKYSFNLIDNFNVKKRSVNKYPRWGDFDMRVLKKAFNEISEKTHLRYKYKGIREGRATKKVCFYDIHMITPVKQLDTETDFNDDPLTMLWEDTQKEIRERNLPSEYIKYCYDKLLELEKSNIIKGDKASYFLGLLNKEMPAWLKIKNEKEEKERKSTEASLKKKEQDDIISEEIKNESEIFEKNLKKFKTLPFIEQVRYLEIVKHMDGYDIWKNSNDQIDLQMVNAWLAETGGEVI